MILQLGIGFSYNADFVEDLEDVKGFNESEFQLAFDISIDFIID